LKRAVAVACFAFGTATSCGDPVHSEEVTALGPETPGVREGPEHRPGQPCLACHGSGGAKPQLSIAGTVYAYGEKKTIPEEGVVVDITDVRGKKPPFTVKTNRAGGFYVRTPEWEPVYPVRVKLIKNGKELSMKSRIHGQGSCAGCHHGDVGTASSVPAVYWRE
jgi:hypothetical protein